MSHFQKKSRLSTMASSVAQSRYKSTFSISIRDRDRFKFIIIALRDNLQDVRMLKRVHQFYLGIGRCLTSMISFRAKFKNGISCVEQAIRYPYSTLSTDSCAIISKSFLSRSSSRIIGSKRTARSW